MTMKGICSYCHKEFTKQNITNHLEGCEMREEAFRKGDVARSVEEHGYCQLLIEARSSEQYWMHVLVREDVTLQLLDDFLRGIWMGDCGQPSSFFIGEVEFASEYEQMNDVVDDDSFQNMKHLLSDLLRSDQGFGYVCGFGVSAILELSMINFFLDLPLTKSIYVMARNIPPCKGLPNSPAAGTRNYVPVEGFDCQSLKVEDYRISRDAVPADLLLDPDLMEDVYFDGEDSGYDEWDDPILDEMEAELEETKKYLFERILKANKPLESNSLADLLNRYDKESLKEICRGNEITKVSTLRKAELIEAMVRELPERYLRKLRALDPEQLGVLKKVSEAGGRAYLEDLFQEESWLRNLWRAQEVLMIFSGTETVEGDNRLVCCLPEEFLTVVQNADWKDLMKTGRRNELLVNLIKGMLYYYGMADHLHILAELRRVCKEDIDALELMPMLFAQSAWYLDFGLWGGHLHHIDVSDPEQLLEDIEYSKGYRRNLEYKELTRQQMLQAADADHVETKAYRAMKRFLMSNYDMDGEEADLEIWNILDGLDEGLGIGAQMEHLSIQFALDDPRDANEFMSHANELYNQHRQWILLGHSPEELYKEDRSSKTSALNVFADSQTSPKKATVYDFSKKKKVGRNDPCPCGSGKKFKKCCGR